MRNSWIRWNKSRRRRFLLDGLSKLEYRGYDSAGVAIMTDEGIVVKKREGRLEKLSNMMTAETQ